MLEITLRARTELLDMLHHAMSGLALAGRLPEATHDLGFRVVSGSSLGRELGLMLDCTRPGDQTFDFQGRLVLLLEGNAVAALGECVLDVTRQEGQEGEGEKLALRPGPGAERVA